ncbi:mediator of RNA polymerase II transcription subunit 1-domain-containing protein [Choanephora cucurbitarum]|nr:mediator of RNA polymerase II transcription subunit 1-domain-containing protein [Choanephora cucurbitarum]
MTEQQSISSAVYGLQGTLRDLQQKLPCLVDKTATERQPNELHALGTVNLDKVRKEFADHINVIRDVCSQFETEVLGDVMKMGAGADPAFRKHFTHLKEQATLESTVLRIKDTLKHTKEFFENTIREKEECKSKIETQRLEKIAQSMGLVTFIDSSQKSESGLPITTITIGGTIIVIDIDIDDTGNVLKAKVTYVSETLQNDQDDRVDAMFAESLQNRQFDLFRRNLACLARLDQLNVKYSSVDFFSILKHLYYDFKQVYQDELQEHSPMDVLLEGHGVPLQHIHYPGLSIAYWMDSQLLLNNQQPTETSFAQAARLLLSFEDSIQTTHYLPKSHTSYLTTQAMEEDHLKRVSETTFQWTRPLEFIKPLGSHPEVKDVPVRWVATLDPPLATSVHVCQQLMAVAGLSNQEFVDVQYSSSCDLSLEEMLVKEDLRKHQWVSVS